MDTTSFNEKLLELHEHNFVDVDNDAYTEAHKEISLVLEDDDASLEDLQQAIDDYIDAARETLQAMLPLNFTMDEDGKQVVVDDERQVDHNKVLSEIDALDTAGNAIGKPDLITIGVDADEPQHASVYREPTRQAMDETAHDHGVSVDHDSDDADMSHSAGGW